MPTYQYIAIGTAVIVLAVTIVSLFLKEDKKKWKKVGKVSKLYVHPVKSMRGVKLEHVLCYKNGICFQNQVMYDRSFLVIQSDGNMMTSRKEPKLVTINVEMKKDNIILNAPGASCIEIPIPKNNEKNVVCKVWGEKTYGLDCGDPVSKWLTNYLDSEYRLVYHLPNVTGRSIAGRDENCKDIFSSIGNIMYHDSTPVHLLSSASVEDLNTRLNKKVNFRSFRPNIVVDGCGPYEEDNWMHVKIGNTEFVYVRDTFRCVLTTVDPGTGVKDADGEPLKTLRQYRTVKKEDLAKYGNSPRFGTSLAVFKEGSISVGDDVYAC